MAKGIIKQKKTPPAGCKKNDNGGIEVNQIIIDLLCERIASGMNQVDACDFPDMPSRTAIYNALKRNPEWAAQVDSVRPILADHKVSEAHKTADDAVQGKTDPAAARLKIEVLKWSATRIDPKRWGDKVSQEVNNTVTVNKSQTDEEILNMFLEKEK